MKTCPQMSDQIKTKNSDRTLDALEDQETQLETALSELRGRIEKRRTELGMPTRLVERTPTETLLSFGASQESLDRFSEALRRHSS